MPAAVMAEVHWCLPADSVHLFSTMFSIVALLICNATPPRLQAAEKTAKMLSDFDSLHSVPASQPGSSAPQQQQQQRQPAVPVKRESQPRPAQVHTSSWLCIYRMCAICMHGRADM